MRNKTKKEEKQQSDLSGSSGQKSGSKPGDNKQSGGGLKASSGPRSKRGGQSGGGQTGAQGN